MSFEILAHRGFWKSKAEQNTEVAFRRALELGCGIETDIRDTDECLVISHNMAASSAMPLENFLKIYKEYPASPTLAMNIKSSEIGEAFRASLISKEIGNYFCFDMAVPDALKYVRAGLTIYTRISEIEPEPSLYSEAVGIWFDVFNGDWLTEEVFAPHTGKKIAIVSPELHGRDHQAVWPRYREFARSHPQATVQLCTDFIDEALDFFSREITQYQ